MEDYVESASDDEFESDFEDEEEEDAQPREATNTRGPMDRKKYFAELMAKWKEVKYKASAVALEQAQIIYNLYNTEVWRESGYSSWAIFSRTKLQHPGLGKSWIEELRKIPPLQNKMRKAKISPLPECAHHYIALTKMTFKTATDVWRTLIKEEAHITKTLIKERASEYTNDHRILRAAAKQRGLKNSSSALTKSKLRDRIASHDNGESLPLSMYTQKGRNKRNPPASTSIRNVRSRIVPSTDATSTADCPSIPPDLAEREDSVTFDAKLGVSDKDWLLFQENGYAVHSEILDPILIQTLRDSAILDYNAIGVDINNEKTYSKREQAEGLHGTYEWNKRCWSKAINIIPLQCPQVYRTCVGYMARLNPELNHLERVLGQLYEAKTRFECKSKTVLSHTDMNPFVLLKEKDAGIPHIDQIQCWIPLYDVTDEHVMVEFGVGCHSTWEEDYRSYKGDLPPLVAQAINVAPYIPNLEQRMRKITNIRAGSLVVFSSKIPHRFTEPVKGKPRIDCYPSYAFWNSSTSSFMAHQSKEKVLSCYIQNKAPDRYAHPYTGNAISSSVTELEPLYPNIPCPLTLLGEVILGIPDRTWESPELCKLVSILFSTNHERRDELETSLNRIIIQLIQPIVSALRQTFSNANTIIKDSLVISRLLETNIGFYE